MRVALADAAPLYRDAPETAAAMAAADRIIQAFMRETLPHRSEDERALAGDLITTAMSEVGKRFSETARTEAEIDAYAEGLADMVCAYLKAMSER